MTKYYVDIPDRELLEGAWVQVAVFDTKKDALNFCRTVFNADEKGRVTLISAHDENEED